MQSRGTVYSVSKRCKGKAEQGEAKISNGIVQYRMVGLCNGRARRGLAEKSSGKAEQGLA